MAASMFMFGINEFALRLPSIILTTLGIWLTFLIAVYFFNKKVAYLAAFFYSINGLIIALASGRGATDHIDVFFLFFIELAVLFIVLFVQKQKTIYNILAGISIGAAILSKWLPALIILPIWLLIVIDSKKFRTKSIVFQFIILVTVCVLVFLPWQIYIYGAYPMEANWEAGYNLKHIMQALDGHGEPFYYYIIRIGMNYGELIYLPMFWFLLKTLKNIQPNADQPAADKNYKSVALCLWFFIPLLFFSFAQTKMQAYLLFTSPALFMMISEFWFMLANYKTKHKPKWLYNLILILLIAAPVRYTIERTTPFITKNRNPQWVADLKKLNDKKINNGVLFNYDKPIEAMFYTNLTSYSNIPDKKVINDLIGKNYRIIINDKGNIPDEIKAINGVMIEYLTTNN